MLHFGIINIRPGPIWPAYVSIFSAFSTLLAVVFALVGDEIRSRCFRPKLEIRMANIMGELTQAEDLKSRVKCPVRYYHLQLLNQKRWRNANDVRAYLSKIGQRENGVWREKYNNPIPLPIKHGEISGQRKVLGLSVEYDFLNVSHIDSTNCLQFCTTFNPSNVTLYFAEGVELRATIGADCIESEANPVAFDISWDGNWNNGESEMAQHLVIKAVQPS